MAVNAQHPAGFYLGSDSDADFDHDDESDDDSSNDERDIEIYTRSVNESGGFDVVVPDNLNGCGLIVPADIHQSSNLKAECEALAKFAIEKHNEKEKSNLEFVDVQKANMQMVCGGMFYLTILVKDKEAGRDLICEAKVWDGIKQDKVLELFRIKPVDEGN